jgi:hypothetical protein
MFVVVMVPAFDVMLTTQHILTNSIRLLKDLRVGVLVVDEGCTKKDSILLEHTTTASSCSPEDDTVFHGLTGFRIMLTSKAFSLDGTSSIDQEVNSFIQSGLKTKESGSGSHCCLDLVLLTLLYLFSEMDSEQFDVLKVRPLIPFLSCLVSFDQFPVSFYSANLLSSSNSHPISSSSPAICRDSHLPTTDRPTSVQLPVAPQHLQRSLAR